MTRTSTSIGRGLPSRSICRFSRTRSSLTWSSSGTSPISSRKMVEPLASSKRPVCRASAPVKAPFSRPNSSLSTSVVRDRAAIDADHRAGAPRPSVRGSRWRAAPCRCRSRRSAAPSSWSARPVRSARARAGSPDSGPSPPTDRAGPSLPAGDTRSPRAAAREGGRSPEAPGAATRPPASAPARPRRPGRAAPAGSRPRAATTVRDAAMRRRARRSRRRRPAAAP